MLGDIYGYILCANIYYGLQTTISSYVEPGYDHLSKSERIVLNMMGSRQLLDKDYNLSTDNWYNSASLAMCLDARNTGMRGTVRCNRGIPPQLRENFKFELKISNGSSLNLAEGFLMKFKICR